MRSATKYLQLKTVNVPYRSPKAEQSVIFFVKACQSIHFLAWRVDRKCDVIAEDLEIVTQRVNEG